MTEITANLCNICLKTNYNNKIIDSSQYLDTFNKLFKNFDSQVGLWLCSWCQNIMKKLNTLLDIAKRRAKLAPDEKNETTNLNINLSYHHNEHIDIPPTDEYITEKYLKEEKIGIKDTKPKLIEQITHIKKSKLKKDKLDEMHFEVNYLSKDEQKKEIEDKKRLEKYKRCSYKCGCCGIGFFGKDDFEEHERRHTEMAGSHTCEICSLRFKTAEVLSQHTLAHRRRFTCLTCRRKFTRWSHCTAHRYKCGNSTPAVCDVCMKIFGDQHSLKMHIKSVHDVKKKYVCDHCNKTLSTKQRLTVHIRCHTGVKPFACTKCSRTFTTNSNLRAHSKVHSDIKDYYCVECNKYYKTEKSLKRHFTESSKHTTIDSKFSCKECSKKFATKKILEKHVELIHSCEHRCIHCSKLFSSNANLRKHLRCIHTSET